MDKKTGIILGVIAAIVVVLVAVVFALDANTEKLDKNTILVVEGQEYKIEEFEKFAKIRYIESGEADKKLSEEETTTMLDEFLLRKIYLTAAKNHNIVLESGDTTNITSDYDSDASVYTNANISKEDYTKYATEKALAEKLQYNLDDYYTLPDETYEAVKDSFEAEDLYKTYSFRLMTIPYEVPESGDESGDVEDTVESGDTEEKEDLSREAQLIVAENVLERIKSGDSFEELAKEYGSTRLTFVGNEYTLINGEIEYATSPLLESKLNNEDVYNAVLKMNSGDVSEIIEDEEYTSFTIVKLESVEEGFVGEGEKELKSVLLLNRYANDVVTAGMHYEMNQAAYIRALYK